MPYLDSILDSLIDPANTGLTADFAKQLLQMRFTDAQAERYESLAERNQDGTLDPTEREELEAFVTANTVLMILKSKARRSLVERPSAA
jgi:hypothetical protein